ncbi:DUF3560 domain-containing protein [Paeniglutamicibacter sp. NPDC091659]|uniref:DUF3560 domain-containing protein n=1 Tax=Paeniglutamicibacter sp. NPDC091659 TaxID=3364389 RepID=UPI0037FADFDC
MNTLTINHTHEAGTLIEGTAKGDGSAEILKANGWRWGRSIAAWFVPMSRDRMPKHYKIEGTAAALRAAGFEVETEIDESTRSTAEVEAGKIERQAQRVEALEAKAQRKSNAADEAEHRAKAAGDALPWGGEPIKIGHHSERRHRNAIDKAHRAMGASVAADRDATEAADRAATAAHTTGARYSVQTVANRIKKLEADARATQRNIDGRREWIKSEAGRDVLSAEPIGATGAYRERLLTRLADQNDQITYWKQIRAEQIAAGEATNYSRETISKGDYVRYRFGWVEVVRANAKTVSVKTEYTWTDKIEYTALTDHKTAHEYAEALATKQAELVS